MSAFINNDTPEEQSADNMSEICENESELAYVNRMKCKYGDERWMWAVEYTEEDCYCLLYTSPSPRDRQKSRMPSSA